MAANYSSNKDCVEGPLQTLKKAAATLATVQLNILLKKYHFQHDTTHRLYKFIQIFVLLLASRITW